MSLWKRTVFSIVSVGLGFCSLDYLMYAFRILTNRQNHSSDYFIQKDGVMQLLGALLFLIWFTLIVFYGWLIRRFSNSIDLIESDDKTGKERVKRRWTDIWVQTGMLLSGILLRWGYLMFVVFPEY